MTRTTRKFPFLTMTIAGLLSGCSVPHGAPTLVPLSAAKLGVPTEKPGVTVADRWWTGLHDAQLDRIVSDSLAGNPGLDEAMARVRAAQAGIAAEKSGLEPQISADVTEQRERLSDKYIIPPPYAGTGRWVGTAQANLDWNLDLAGRQKALIAQARSGAEASSLDLAAARITIVSAVCQAYVNLARADTQVRIADEFVISRHQSLELAQSRRGNKLTSDFDVRTAETLVAEAEQARVRAAGERDLIVHALAALAGRGPDYYAAIAAPDITLDAALPLPDKIPADLLGRRPDLLAAMSRIDAADAGRRVSRADFYPNVDLRAFVGASAIGLGSLFTGGALMGGGGPAIHLPIFEGGRLKAQYQGSLANEDVAIAQYNGLVVRALRETADALSAIRTSADDAAAQRRILAGLTATQKLDTSRVRNGLGTQLDVLSTNDRLLAAAQALANIDADGLNHRIQLAVAVGGGFQPISAPAAIAAAK